MYVGQEEEEGGGNFNVCPTFVTIPIFVENPPLILVLQGKSPSLLKRKINHRATTGNNTTLTNWDKEVQG